MKTNHIIYGIIICQTKEQLTEHLDHVQRAIDKNECDFDNFDWMRIQNKVQIKTNEFDERVFH